MSRVIYLPLEEMNQRYTGLFNAEMSRISDIVIHPKEEIHESFSSTAFLDFPNSCAFKAEQIAMVSRMFAKSEIQSGDVFLIADIFFPGLETIKLLSELAGVKTYICAFNHAGRADDTDFLQCLDRWSDEQERVWHSICDIVFVGSFHHLNRVKKHFGTHLNKVVVTGMPFNSDYYSAIEYPVPFDKKKDRIIWPHRPTKEKGIEEFGEIVISNPNLTFVLTTGGKADPFISNIAKYNKNIEYYTELSKKEYLNLLNYSKYYLSTAHQETFGYTLHEAIHYGCAIIAPNRACYPEVLSHDRIYTEYADINHLLTGEETVIKGAGRNRFHNNRLVIQSYLKNLQNGNL